MKKVKKIAALLLALALVLSLFAACGSDSGSSTPESSTQEESSGSSAQESSSETESSETGSNAQDDGTVHPMRIVQPGILSDEYEQGIADVNAKLAADGVNIEVSVQRIPWDSYAEKLNVMLVTGEEFELLHVMQDVKNLSAIAGMDALMPLDSLLEKYPDLVANFTENEWLGAVYNGDHYAVPCSWHSFDNTMAYMTVRTDTMKKVGYEEFPAESVDDVLDLMKKSQDDMLEETNVKAYNWFHQNQDTAHWLHRTYDTYPFYVENSLGLIIARQDGTIDSFYESDEFKQDCEVYQKMFQQGLINPDILNMDSQVKYDQANLGAFLPSQTFDPSVSKTIMEKTELKDVTADWFKMCPDKPDMIYTFVQNLNAISSTSEDPESGLKFLQWLYASQENHDLFHYGTPGKYFTDEGEGMLSREDSMKNENGDALYYMDTWMTGYMPFMRYDSAIVTDEYLSYQNYRSENYVISPVAGFLFDSSNVTSELTNLQTEIIASIYPIKIGMVSYEENIGPAIEKLKAAGLDTYLEEYRTQFKAYLDANPNVLEMAKGTTAG
ncbi:extracellular solute-binding protein [Acutalibacter intestini]|uniref:extracellular solute-binding protein n=1 Tax=Acutalibacter intestini TaxID=3093659 RepID=UPI002AC8E71F|nr:extracellular solute-binding protein [Acutalibacter sp. M00204]